YFWHVGMRCIRLPSGYSDRKIDHQRHVRPRMTYDLNMRETGNRTDFGLSAGLAASLASALLFGATTPISKQLLKERRRPLQVVAHITIGRMEHGPNVVSAPPAI